MMPDTVSFLFGRGGVEGRGSVRMLYSSNLPTVLYWQNLVTAGGTGVPPVCKGNPRLEGKLSILLSASKDKVVKGGCLDINFARKKEFRQLK